MPAPPLGVGVQEQQPRRGRLARALVPGGREVDVLRVADQPDAVAALGGLGRAVVEALSIDHDLDVDVAAVRREAVEAAAEPRRPSRSSRSRPPGRAAGHRSCAGPGHQHDPAHDERDAGPAEPAGRPRGTRTGRRARSAGTRATRTGRRTTARRATGRTARRARTPRTGSARARRSGFVAIAFRDVPDSVTTPDASVTWFTPAFRVIWAIAARHTETAGSGRSAWGDSVSFVVVAGCGSALTAPPPRP